MLAALFLVANFASFASSTEESCGGGGVRISRCAAIFENPQNCFNSTYQFLAQECKVTCSLCDAFSCVNPQSESVLNCTDMAESCQDPAFKDFLKVKCPATCGTCMDTNSKLCSDKQSPQKCSSLSKFCNSLDYYDFLTEQCPSTCNRCNNGNVNPSGGGVITGAGSGTAGSGSGTGTGTGTVTVGCKDVVNDCNYHRARCTDSTYQPLMDRLCSKTCNTCKDCVDFNNSCQNWASRGFCKQYNTSITQKHCPKTCGLCS